MCTYGTGRETCDAADAPSAIAAATAKLAPLLGTTPDALRPKLTGSLRYRVLDKNVSPDTWRKIAALGIPGVYRDPAGASAERVYPQGATTASLVGFTIDGGKPGGGVEEMVNSALQGTPGSAEFETSASGTVIPAGRQEITPAKNGRNVTLTINSNLQWYAQNALAAKVKQTNALSGTVVAMNAKTGQLLAVASYPSFDPNHVGTAQGSLVNKAFNDVFEPGSTGKIMTMAAAMQEGNVTPRTPVVIPGSLHRYDTTFHDSHPHGTEYRTVAGTLAESSNLGTILVGETMRPATLASYFHKFGLGSTSGMGFPGESAGLLAPAKDWSGTQRATVVYGQGLSVTAIQAASVFQTIANGGRAGPAAPHPERRGRRRPSGSRGPGQGGAGRLDQGGDEPQPDARECRLRPGHRAGGPDQGLPRRRQDRAPRTATTRRSSGTAARRRASSAMPRPTTPRSSSRSSSSGPSRATTAAAPPVPSSTTS